MYLNHILIHLIRLVHSQGEPDDDEEDEEEERTGQKRSRDHSDSAANEGPQPIDQVLFKKYLTYSRAFVKPVLQAVDSEKVRAYVRMYVRK